MLPNLLNVQDRMRIIDQIKGSKDVLDRKALSLKQFEIQSDRLEQYVMEHLRKGFSEQTVQETPVISSINVQKRVVDEQATVYKKKPTRSFEEMTNDDQAETMALVYEDARVNVKMHSANKAYKYQDQSQLMVVPSNGKLVERVLLKHHYDVIPDPMDPEGLPYGYIVSVFDKEDYLYEDGEKFKSATGYIEPSKNRQGQVNETALDIATEKDYKRKLEKYIVWTRSMEGIPALNFMMDGNGQIMIGGKLKKRVQLAEILSPLNGQKKELPFVDIARFKDFEFFVRSGNSITDFTVQFNSLLSDMANSIRMNGYAIGVLKGPSTLKPENQILGANMFMFLPTDETITADQIDFNFVSPNASIAEITDALDMILNYFLSSVGSDSSAVNSSGQTQSFTSGVERMLSMFERFEASQEDFEVFSRAEGELFNVFASWLNVLDGTDTLEEKYQMGQIPSEAYVKVTYDKPEIIQTESEKLDLMLKEINNGIESRITGLMKYRDMTREEAEAHATQVDEDEVSMIPAPLLPSAPGFNGGLMADKEDEE